MTLAGKRRVIEVLLYCGNPGEDRGIGDTLTTSLGDLPIFEAASIARQQVLRDRGGDRDGMTLGDGDYEADCLEAAYRLIDSLPTLRLEWFGAR